MYRPNKLAKRALQKMFPPSGVCNIFIRNDHGINCYERDKSVDYFLLQAKCAKKSVSSSSVCHGCDLKIDDPFIYKKASI